jgi:hypothetical protein
MKLPPFFERFTPYVEKLKVFLFGVDNIYIEKALDAFFNLKPVVRNKIVIYGTAFVATLCLVIVGMYLYSMISLQHKLETSLELERQILALQPKHSAIQQQFDQLSESLSTTNKDFASLPKTLQDLGTDVGVQVDIPSGLPQMAVLPSTHPMAARFKLAKMDCTLKNTSLKKFMDYIAQVQESPNRFVVSSLEIEQIFGTKLYFDVTLTIEAYVPS